MIKKERKKTWCEKVEEVKNSYLRSLRVKTFSRIFYNNLFFLNPKIEAYFSETDMEHQEKALLHGLDHLMNFLDQDSDDHDYHRTQLVRIALTHSKVNLNIHPHDYYYWTDALVMTIKKTDYKWHDDLEYYFRECLFFPISFMISFYHDKRRPEALDTF